MKIYDVLLTFAGCFFAGGVIGALSLQHYTDAYAAAIAAAIGLYYGRRFWKNFL